MKFARRLHVGAMRQAEMPIPFLQAITANHDDLQTGNTLPAISVIKA